MQNYSDKFHKKNFAQFNRWKWVDNILNTKSLVPSELSFFLKIQYRVCTVQEKGIYSVCECKEFISILCHVIIVIFSRLYKFFPQERLTCLDWKFELAEEFRDEERMLELFSHLHDSHHCSIDLILTVLEHLEGGLLLFLLLKHSR